MSGVGVDGFVMDGWAHVHQSIQTILTTPIGARVMRRDFGSDIPSLVDAPMNAANIMALFAATAAALEPRQVDGFWYGEPRFRLSQIEVVSVAASGRIALACSGTYFPNGHKGDLSRGEAVSAAIALGYAS